MNINKISKTVLALSLLFTSFSCSVVPTANQVVENNQVSKSQENNGTIVVNLGSLFGSVSNKFSVKSYKYNDSAVEKIKISVYSAKRDSNGIAIVSASNSLPEMEKTIKKSDNLSEVFLSVASGKNKVVTIETFDNKDIQLTRLMGAIDIYGGVNTTLRINYGTYPTSDILKKLIIENSTLSLAILNNIELVKLEKFVNQITGYDANSNTYGGINPAYLDTNKIIEHLKTNEGLLNGASVPSYKGDVKAYMFISSKNNEFGLYTSGNNSILYNTNNANIFDFQGKIAVGDIIFLNETDSEGNNEQEYQFNVVAVTANNITLDRNFIPATGRFVRGISFPDIKKYDNQIKGKLRLTVLNANNQPVKGVKYELNDLTATNVSSSIENITTIENISQGEFTLRVTAYINGKTLQYKKIYNVTAISNTFDETFTENIELKENIPQTGGIRLERLNDNDNLPAPTNIDLSTGYSIGFKAFIKMEDGSENQDVTWTSSNTNIASVSGGTVYGVGAGIATITVASRIDPSINTSFSVNVTATQSNGPVINSFTPSGSGIDTEVIIKGYRFTDLDVVPLPVPTVKFIGTTTVTATVIDFKENEIKVKVPVGATTGKISVQTTKGTFVSQDYFIVTNIVNPNPNNNADPNLTSGMVFIPATDKFYMGANGNTNDNFYPRHKVILNSFHIDRTEVTNKQFGDFIEAGGYTTDNSGIGNNVIDGKPNIKCWSPEGLAFRDSNNLNSSTARPSYWNDTRFNQPNQPVVGISWYEAQAYAKWAGKRLATEAEWEYAARGTNERAYPWGGDSPSEGNKKANGFFGNLGSGDGYQYTNEVGKFNDGDSAFGLKDMSGNVYEWTNDYYDAKYYTENVANNPQGPSISGSKVLRGGSWYNHPYFENNDSKISDSMKTYTRFYSSPANRSNYIGFRTAL